MYFQASNLGPKVELNSMPTLATYYSRIFKGSVVYSAGVGYEARLRISYLYNITAGSTELFSFNFGIELSPSLTRLRGMMGYRRNWS